MLNKLHDEIIKKLTKAIHADNLQKIVVGAVITNNENDILLLKRVADDFMGGLVELPSGSVNKGEEILESLQREVKEETGLNIISIDNYVGEFDYISSSEKKTRQLTFSVSVEGVDIQLNPKEHSNYYWISFKNDLYETLNISNETRKIIEQAMR
jgi:8-oxo-dGTP diphosphatase